MIRKRNMLVKVLKTGCKTIFINIKRLEEDLMKRGYALDKKRKESLFDISLIELIDEIVKRGENPLCYSVCIGGNSVTITTYQLFLYYRYKNKDFDIIVKGGKTYGSKL